jgi:CubicO group peptidase (beta-lactamase class C family)
MAAGGLSEQRLQRMRGVLARHIERGLLPGAVTLISRKGVTHVETIGAMAVGGAPMRRDTIFRITSMTKPIVAAAAMILIEECRLRLDDPIDGFLPELANRKVLKRLDGPLDETVPAHRAITLRDLLTFRLGWGMLFGTADHYPILKAIEDLGIVGFGPPDQATPHDDDEWLRRLGSLPLMNQPGETWRYNTGLYVLGVLIARVTGKSLEAFLRERIFEPLGMTDTGFSVPPAKLDRLATSYWANATGGIDLYDAAPDSRWSRPPVFEDGGAGLVSTIDDYAAFGQMMLNKGRHGKDRILSRLSVELMTTDHLSPDQKTSSGFLPGYWDHRGWGLGLSVTTGRDELSAVPGRFGWDGGFGTSWFADPHEDMSAILMTQRAEFPLMSEVYRDFWTSVYQAIDD